MKLRSSFLLLVFSAGMSAASLRADERRFTYTYEPETLPAGALEFENWVTLRAGKGAAAGMENFNAWDLRQEVEYGVTDRYTVSLYLNEQAESYRDPASGADESGFEWKGLSLENRYNLVNPADHAVGISLYLEGTYSGEEAAVEEKIIFGQRHGDWKWAFNLIHETEWKDKLRQVEGQVGASLGVARDLGKNWSLGLEARNSTTLPDYDGVESSAVFVGPVISYRQEHWWAALSIMPQVYGWNKNGGDGNTRLDLVDNEKLNVRLLLGFSF